MEMRVGAAALDIAELDLSFGDRRSDLIDLLAGLDPRHLATLMVIAPALLRVATMPAPNALPTSGSISDLSAFSAAAKALALSRWLHQSSAALVQEFDSAKSTVRHCSGFTGTISA